MCILVKDNIVIWFVIWIFFVFVVVGILFFVSCSDEKMFVVYL